MSLKRTLKSAVFLACCHFSLAQAGLTSLDEVDSGIVRYNYVACLQGGGDSSSHSPGLNKVGLEVTPCGFGQAISSVDWGYLIFDLASVTAPANSAAVSLTVSGLTGVDGVLSLSDYTLTSASALSDLPAGNLSTAFGADLHSDFSSGNLLGSVSLNTGSSRGVYDIQLSAYALGLINGTSDLLAFGVSYWPSFNGAIFFENINIASPTQLKLETSVPVPATLFLLAFGLAMLGLSRQKKA